MPRAAWTDDLDTLEAIEDSLPADLKEALRAQFERMELAPDAWLDPPGLRQTLTAIAAWNIIHGLRAKGFSKTAARTAAAERLGIEYETVRSLMRRWDRHLGCST